MSSLANLSPFRNGSFGPLVQVWLRLIGSIGYLETCAFITKVPTGGQPIRRGFEKGMLYARHAAHYITLQITVIGALHWTLIITVKHLDCNSNWSYNYYYTYTTCEPPS